MKRSKAKPLKIKTGNATVTIYTRTKTVDGNAYSVFEVADFTSGRRKLISFSDRAEAIRRAEDIGRLLSCGSATAAGMSNADAASYGRAIELTRETGDPLELVAARYAQAVQILGSGEAIIGAARFFAARNPANFTQRTVAEAADEFIADRAAEKLSHRYTTTLRWHLDRFSAVFKTNIGNVTTADVQSFIDGLRLQKKEGKTAVRPSAQTRKNFKTIIGTLFSFAERKAYIARGSNPVTHVTVAKVSRTEDIEIYTPAELAALIKAADARMLPMLTIAAFTGIRTAELLRLDWSDLDLNTGFVTVTAGKAKTKSRRIIPICPALSSWLAPYAHKAGPVWPVGSFFVLQRAVAKRAGIPWRQNALRHSFASYRLAETQDAARVALEMGNSPQMIFKHYRELVRPDAAKAWFNILPDQPANVTSLQRATA